MAEFGPGADWQLRAKFPVRVRVDPAGRQAGRPVQLHQSRRLVLPEAVTAFLAFFGFAGGVRACCAK